MKTLETQLAKTLRSAFIAVSGGYKVKFPYLTGLSEADGKTRFYVNANEEENVFDRVAKKLVSEQTNGETVTTQYFYEMLCYLGIEKGWEEKTEDFNRLLNKRDLNAFAIIGLPFCSENPSENPLFEAL